MKQFIILGCLFCILFTFSSFTGTKTNEPKVTNISSVTLEQTCGDRIDGMVYLTSGDSQLFVKFGETSSFRIDWSGETNSWREYYPKGTTVVPVYADRFTISVPGESSSSVKSYCFVIHR